MTVKDLIDYLSTLPQAAKVGCLYRAFSDIQLMDIDDISFLPGPEIQRPYGGSCRYVLRNGKVMEYDEKTWPSDEVPEFISVVVFPGN